MAHYRRVKRQLRQNRKYQGTSIDVPYYTHVGGTVRYIVTRTDRYGVHAAQIIVGGLFESLEPIAYYYGSFPDVLECIREDGERYARYQAD